MTKLKIDNSEIPLRAALMRVFSAHLRQESYPVEAIQSDLVTEMIAMNAVELDENGLLWMTASGAVQWATMSNNILSDKNSRMHRRMDAIVSGETETKCAYPGCQRARLIAVQRFEESEFCKFHHEATRQSAD